MTDYSQIITDLSRELKTCGARVSEKHSARERDFVDHVGCRLDVMRSIDEVYHQAEEEFRAKVELLERVRAKRNKYVEGMLSSVKAMDAKLVGLEQTEKRIRDIVTQEPEALHDAMQEALKKVAVTKKVTTDELEDMCDTVYLWFFKMGVQVSEQLRDQVTNTAMRSKINTTLYPAEQDQDQGVATSAYAPCSHVNTGASASGSRAVVTGSHSATSYTEPVPYMPPAAHGPAISPATGSRVVTPGSHSATSYTKRSPDLPPAARAPDISPSSATQNSHPVQHPHLSHHIQHPPAETQYCQQERCEGQGHVQTAPDDVIAAYLPQLWSSGLGGDLGPFSVRHPLHAMIDTAINCEQPVRPAPPH